MIVTKKAIPRRTVLRGVGTALALPLLDGMVPALTALTRTAANPAKRLGVVYVPNGIITQNGNWAPETDEAGFALPRLLKPMEPVRKHLTILSNLDNRAAFARPGEALGSHSRPAAAFLTGIHAEQTQGSELDLGTSMDQYAAQAVGSETRLPSLELSLEGADTFNGVSTCDTGYSCAYLNISWHDETTPMPRETNPRMVFERLFGDAGSTDAGVRLARAQQQRSILDAVMDKVARLRGDLDGEDRRKLDNYLDAVREIERRIEIAERQADRELPLLESPAGIPVSFDDHARLMYDLLLLAYQTDVTRVFTYMIGREQSGTTYPQIGVPDPHHPLTHHRGDVEKIEKVTKINQYHVQLFSEFVAKMAATPDGDGSLIDNVMLLYGAALRDGDAHQYNNIPLLLVGHGGGQIKGDRHLIYPPDANPMTNLQLTMLQMLGVPMDRFGDSTGTLRELTGLS
ncbi:MAG: DUF1552 domain-containing protein [Acidobacteria bacterium]|nr:DUF1552 domain-containing protein [Acidobacteriota bacterium]